MSKGIDRGSLISIVIPVYNEGPSVRLVVDQLLGLYPQAEIIVVNDGSVDDTARMLSGALVRVISHECNRGYGAAIKTGIAAASRDIVVTIDADGEHVPEEIARLVGGLSNVDMVVGSRNGSTSGSGLIKIIGRMILGEAACFFASTRIPDINSGLRVFRKKSIVTFLPMFPDTFSFHTTSTLAILFTGGCIKYIFVPVRPRVGVSKVRLRDGWISLMYVIMLTARLRSGRLWAGIGMVGGAVLWFSLLMKPLMTPERLGVMLGVFVAVLLVERLSRASKIGLRILKEEPHG